MSVAPIRLACIGAFGHTGDVLSELAREELPFEVIGWAPAFPGESGDRIMAGPYFQGARRFEDHAALLAAKPEWVIIGTQLHHIAKISADCLKAGAHVIAEKPLAIRRDDLAMLHEVWRGSGRHLGAMLTMENEPAIRAARAAVLEGRVGRVILAEARKSYKWGTRPEWFGDAEKYGGTFAWVGIHALNMVQFVAGVDFTGGSSRQANLAHPTHPGCEDVCVASLTTNTGALVNITVDIARPQTADTHGDDWCRIVGTDGVLEANASEGWCRLLRGVLVDLDLPPRGGRFAATIQRVMRGDLSCDETARAFHLTETSLLARDFSATGEPFRLSESVRWDI